MIVVVVIEWYCKETAFSSILKIDLVVLFTPMNSFFQYKNSMKEIDQQCGKGINKFSKQACFCVLVVLSFFVFPETKANLARAGTLLKALKSFDFIQ